MLVAYNVDVPMERLPVANWVLIAVTCFCSLGILFGWHPDKTRKHRDLDPHHIDWDQLERETAEDEIPPMSLRRVGLSASQLFTHVLVHADLLHLLGNMFFLFCFGNAVNAKLGQVLYLAAYFLLGAVGGLAWLALGHGDCAVGASGAIMGVTGMFLVFFPRNDVYILYWWSFAYAGSFELAAGWWISFYVVCDLVGVLLDPGGQISYISHLAGALCGIGLACGLLVLGLARPGRGEENFLQVLGWQDPDEERGRRKKRRRRRLRDDEE
jgi:membrane associated rhomboid family serine protease